MKKNILLALPFLALMLLSSCAASFTSLNPKSFYYSNTTITDSVKLSYKYNVLTERGNKKYAKKELKMGVKITAIKIVNNGNETLRHGENFKFVSGDKDVIPLDPLTTFQKVKQKTTSHYPIGLVVGPGLAIGNLLYASSSNSKFKEELLQYDVLGKDIKPGETGTFLLSFQNVEFGPLGIKMIK
jgi:hypothetical protein